MSQIQFREVPDHALVISVDKWIRMVEKKPISGFGYWATVDQESTIKVRPTTITKDRKIPPPWATHVTWYS